MPLPRCVSVAAGAVCLLLAPAGGSDAAQRSVVLATGDSMVQPMNAKLERELKRRRPPADVPTESFPASGVSKPWRKDWVKYAPRQVKRYRPVATVMFLGANDGYPMRTKDGPEVDCCRRAWVEEYARRARSMMRSYTTDGRHAYWLTLPAPRRASFVPAFAAVNAAIRMAAEDSPRVHVIDLAEFFTPGWRYRRRMVIGDERVVVRERDGVHLSPAGAAAAARIVQRALVADSVIR